MFNKVNRILIKYLIYSIVVVLLISCSKKNEVDQQLTDLASSQAPERTNVEVSEGVGMKDRFFEGEESNVANESDNLNLSDENNSVITEEENNNIVIEPFLIKQTILFGNYNYYQNDIDDTIFTLYDPWASNWNQRELVRIGNLLFNKLWLKQNWEEYISDQTYLFVKDKLIELQENSDKPEKIVWGAASIDGDWGWVRFRFDYGKNKESLTGIIYYSFKESWLIEDIQK